VALVLAMTLGPAVPCRADLLIEAPDVAAAPGSSGSFDVLLVNTNPAGGASYDVAADSLGLSLAGPLSVRFTGVSIHTVAAPYVYVTSGTTAGGGPLSLDTFPNTQFTASDSEFAASGFRAVNPGETFGLAHVSFAISPKSPLGTDTIAFTSTATSLSDQNGNPIAVSLVNGSIGTATTSAVPEPSALIVVPMAALIGLGSSWWRRRRQTATAR
jgi:hypothetical protein